MSTIAAISTGRAAGGIGVVRISGEAAVAVADRVFRAANGRPLTDLPGYHAAFGTVFADGEPLDEAVALVFRAPKSYTGEDVVELSCHGGLYLTERLLRAVLQNGAVAAGPGEFTRRAFLNGKMDLTRAEGVMQAIAASGEQAQKAAYGALEGRLSAEIDRVAAQLKQTSASLAAWVDYPDEDIDDLTDEALLAALADAHLALTALLARFDSGRAVREGADVAIVGRPNVGKSTLMNLLSGEERSIVTDIAGTTRDVVEQTVTLAGLTLRLSDTAGLRETDDAVERIGVQRAETALARADLILAVFDAGEPLDAQDARVLALCRDRAAVAVVNKTDLPVRLDLEKINTTFKNVVQVSAKTQDGLPALEAAVAAALGTAQYDASAPQLANERQFACCRDAAAQLSEAKTALESGVTRDAVQVLLDAAIEALDALTGRRATETVVDTVFSRFCVGK